MPPTQGAIPGRPTVGAPRRRRWPRWGCATVPGQAGLRSSRWRENIHWGLPHRRASDRAIEQGVGIIPDTLFMVKKPAASPAPAPAFALGPGPERLPRLLLTTSHRGPGRGHHRGGVSGARAHPGHRGPRSSWSRTCRGVPPGDRVYAMKEGGIPPSHHHGRDPDQASWSSTYERALNKAWTAADEAQLARWDCSSLRRPTCCWPWLINIQRTTDFIIVLRFREGLRPLTLHGRLSFGHMLYLGVGPTPRR